MDKIINFTVAKSKEHWKGYYRQLYDVAISCVFVSAKTFVSFLLLQPRLPLNSMIALAGLQLVVLLLQHTKCQCHKPHLLCLSFLVCTWGLSSGFPVVSQSGLEFLILFSVPKCLDYMYLSLVILNFFFNMPHR